MAAPHVVMMVSNDVMTDSRVKKEALALASLGLRVTVVGQRSARTRPLELLGDVRIVRVPVASRLVQDQARRRARRRTIRLPGIGYPDARAEEAARLRLRLSTSRLFADTWSAVRDRRSGETGLTEFKAGVVKRRVQGASTQAKKRMLWLRAGAGRRVDRVVKDVVSTWDDWVSAQTTAARWWRLHPDVLDYELAYGPVIDALEPDVLHAHDVQVIGIASQASARAYAEGRRVPWVYDAHEYVAGLSQYGARGPRAVAGWLDLERRYIKNADRVVTVSGAIAQRLESAYQLARRPEVVLNIPSRPSPSDAASEHASLRSAIGVDAETMVLVYSGGITSARGVRTAVEAMQRLNDAHLAVVCVPSTRTDDAAALRALAAELGVEGRVHLLEPVSANNVVQFLSSADIGLIPILPFPSHDMALPNKVFEYVQAGLPVITTDLHVLGEVVRREGIGATFEAGDAQGLARAVLEVRARQAQYRLQALQMSERHEYTWQAQVEVLADVYAELAGSSLPRPSDLHPIEQPSKASQAGGRRLVIGPANMAGQAWEWKRAIEVREADLKVDVMAVQRGAMAYEADVVLSPEAYSSIEGSVERLEALLTGPTHVLFETGRSLVGWLTAFSAQYDADILAGRGVRCGLVLHGSEARDPSQHRELYEFSPFRDPGDPMTSRLQQAVAATQRLLEVWDGPVFVTTPDMLDFVPDARLLPVVVDTARWLPGEPALSRARPVVLHAPSNRILKSSDAVDRVCRKLEGEGLISYRPIEGIANRDLASVIAQSDVVVDQLAVGNYGVLACEAMSAQRLVIGHVLPGVRERVPGLPIVQADPTTLEEVLRGVLAEREASRELALAGREFVSARHDGRLSAEVLAKFVDQRALAEPAPRVE